MSSGYFILGYPRSGTTLFRAMLNSHSQIAIPFESFVILDYARNINRDYNDLLTLNDREQLVKDLLNSKGISEWEPKVYREDIIIERCADYSSTIREIFDTYAKKCGKLIWCDKTPSYTPDLHILNELFPSSKFIHIIRDGRDVAASILRQPWGQYSMIKILEDWNQIVNCTRKMGRMLGKERYLEIRFEDLVSSPEVILRSVLEFMDLPFEESVLRKKGGNTNTLLPQRSMNYHTNLSKQPDSGFAYKWQKELSRTDQVLCSIIAKDLFSEIGYPPGCTECSSIRRVGRNFYHYLHQGLSWRFQKIKNTLSNS